MDVQDVQPAARGAAQRHQVVRPAELPVLLLGHDGPGAALQGEEDAVRSGVDDIAHVSRQILGNGGQRLVDNDRVLSQMGEELIAVARRVHRFRQWTEDGHDHRSVEAERIPENRDRLGSLPKIPGSHGVDWLDQPPVIDRGDRFLGKGIGEVRHDFRDVERELVIEEAQRCFRHGATGAFRLKVVPEADGNPIDLGAIDGRLHAFGARHVVDLKPPS